MDLTYTDARVAQQLRLEELIKAFKPDAYEAGELIACVLKKLRDEELDVYAEALYKSLDRLEARQPRDSGNDEDEAYDLWRARQE